jgi:hypothetical protein
VEAAYLEERRLEAFGAAPAFAPLRSKRNLFGGMPPCLLQRRPVWWRATVSSLDWWQRAELLMVSLLRPPMVSSSGVCLMMRVTLMRESWI